MDFVRGARDWFQRRRPRRAAALAVAIVAVAGLPPAHASAATPLTGVDLARYVRVGRYDLPEPTRTQAPPGSLLAQEASSVTYDWDTDTLFVVGDGGTSVVQVDKTGKLVNSMTLAAGTSPQGTAFYDTEGITYVGHGQFVMTEERYRQVDLFTYVPNTTLTLADVKTVKLGTTIGNIGLEGISNDPYSGGFLVVKEMEPEGIFQTGIDFNAGTATNGSPTTDESVNLFDPSLAGLDDFSDVFSLSNLTTLTGPDTSHFLIISQQSGKIENLDRTGKVSSALTIRSDPGNPLSVPDQTHEGVTMDNDGFMYTVSEDGGGDANHPQLWVYAPSTAPDLPPTGVTLSDQVSALPDTTSTASPVKVADVSVADPDQLGNNVLGVTGPDASSFQVDATGLYLKAGTVLNHATKSTYTVSVTVDDPSVGATPDATSAPYTLNVTAGSAGGTTTGLTVSEVSPWSSGNAPYMADWWELTNTSTQPVSLAGWKMDDNSNSFGNAVALNGVGSLAPGQSAVFVEGTAATDTAFEQAWFGSKLPAGFQIGYYEGSGVGLSTDGDAVNVFDANGNRVTGVAFGTSTTGQTFDNSAGLGTTALPLPVISQLSVAGRNGAFVGADGTETGSPGTTAPQLAVTEVSPWSSGSAPYAADWWELTNTGAHAVDLTGFRMDDNSNAFANAVALNGVSSLAPGQSAVFVEGTAATDTAFETAWFGGSIPAGFQIGFYEGSGVGLSTDGDAVNVFDSTGRRITGVAFGSSTTGRTFDNSARLGATTLPLPVISQLSTAGVNGAFVAADGTETGSPGGVSPAPQTTVGGTVPAQLALSLGSAPSFGAFTAGVAKDYLASLTATVVSTAGDAALSVSDPSSTAPGHLVNGTFALPQALQADADGGGYVPVSGSPATLLSYSGPVSNDQVSVGLKQPIGATDALRTGTYSKTLTFTLSTTTP